MGRNPFIPKPAPKPAQKPAPKPAQKPAQKPAPIVPTKPACDASCQREKKIADLKRILEEKKTNVVTAPEQVFIARKNYLEYIDGKQEYINKREKELRSAVNTWKNNTNNSWRSDVARMLSYIVGYENSYNNLLELNDYYARIALSTNTLKQEYDFITAKNSTNDRKAYYEMQGTEELEWWYMFMKWTYILLVIAFIVACFLTPTTYSWKMRGSIIIFLIAYPFIISSMAISSFASIRGILSMLPYNTFTHALGVSFSDENTNVKMSHKPSYQVSKLKVKI